MEAKMNTFATCDKIKPRVLFVDDDTRLLSAAQRLLRKKLDITIASSATKALQLIKEHNSFPIVITDQNMPGIKGDQFLNYLKKNYPSTVRIMLSGNCDNETALKAVNEGGVFKYVRKPCQPDDLLKVIEEAWSYYSSSESSDFEETLNMRSITRLLNRSFALFHPKSNMIAQDVIALLLNIRQFLPDEALLNTEEALMLLPLAEQALPYKVIQKSERREELTDDEKQRAQLFGDILQSIFQPMHGSENLLKVLLHCRSSFDGTSVPYLQVNGYSLPIQSRLLKILIDLVYASQGLQEPLQICLEVMRNSSGRYDLELFDAVENAISQVYGSVAIDGVIECKASELEAGDKLAEALRCQDGELIYAKGNILNSTLLPKIKQLHADRGILEPVRVVR
jgi:CheY-like chemotaxis protein